MTAVLLAITTGLAIRAKSAALVVKKTPATSPLTIFGMSISHVFDRVYFDAFTLRNAPEQVLLDRRRQMFLRQCAEESNRLTQLCQVTPAVPAHEDVHPEPETRHSNEFAFEMIAGKLRHIAAIEQDGSLLTPILICLKGSITRKPRR